MSKVPLPAPEPAPASDAPPRAADRIRASARKLFYSEGIRAIGVDQIVAEAGVTKPSLYRSFASKDDLAADYLRDYEKLFWSRFEAPLADFPDDPRAQLLAYLTGLAERACKPGYRGCGLSNAAVEYPQVEHPARLVSTQHKRELRERLVDMSTAMGAADPARLADGLLLLLEGAFVSGQLFGEGGPAARVAEIAGRMIDGEVAGRRRPPALAKPGKPKVRRGPV